MEKVCKSNVDILKGMLRDAEKSASSAGRAVNNASNKLKSLLSEVNKIIREKEETISYLKGLLNEEQLNKYNEWSLGR